MECAMPDFKNIIFDLGGVILNLNPQATIDRFKDTGMDNVEEFYSLTYHADFILDFETGKITTDDFRRRIREISKIPITDDQIDFAWSGMLLDIPKERVNLLLKLNETYRIFLLSNTNPIHIHYFNERVKKDHGVEGLEALFEKCYYSSDIGYRKPNAKAFQFVLDKEGIKPEETLFVDDILYNIEAAVRLSLKTLHVSEDIDLIEWFGKYLSQREQK
ncbi:MAG: HAD family phosphatase [Bacteroidales bacterium]|nr:HAD family phosphatase [Bacteroidales bacterium]